MYVYTVCTMCARGMSIHFRPLPKKASERLDKHCLVLPVWRTVWPPSHAAKNKLTNCVECVEKACFPLVHVLSSHVYVQFRLVTYHLQDTLASLLLCAALSCLRTFTTGNEQDLKIAF